MIGSILKPELQEMIEQRHFPKLREVLAQFPPAEIAEILSDLEPTDRAVLIRILPHQLAADVFEHLGHEDQEQLLHALGTEKVAQILNEMEPDDRTAILEELPANVTQQLLNFLSPEERRIAVTLLGYPENSIGRRMTPEYVAIKQEWTVAQVLEHLRKVGKEREALNQLFVVEGQGKLIGVVRLRKLVVTDLQTPVTELLEQQFVSLRATDDQETAVSVFMKYDRTILPVVDSYGILVGVVTVDDVLDVAAEEATEDIHKAGAVSPLTTSLLKSRLSTLYKRRVSWLVMLVFVNLLSVFAMTFFEEMIASAIAVMFFLPLLIASGGNSGSQAATLVIRSLALGEVESRDYYRVLLREVSVALSLGITMSVTVFLVALPLSGLPVALSVSIAMIAVVFFGSLLGLSLPFVLSRLNMDPAAASTPLVTVLADIMGVLIYLSIAKVLLGVLGVA
jgi:magnesium transporter